jgi:uncharacterized protein (TIGR02444 family)
MSAGETTSNQGSPFWRFSLGFYRRPGVGDACIVLQDACGVDVNLMLFLLWLAASNRGLSVDDVTMLEAKVRDWRELVIASLRHLRRKLKDNAPLVEPGPAEAFRSKIKAAELEAERLQQEALYDVANSMTLGKPHASAESAARANIAAYEAVVGRSFPAAPVDLLFGAFCAFAEAGVQGRDP